MSRLIYKKISLFDTPEDSVLVHACNGKGAWGSGIAKEFKKRFPEAYKQYSNYCKEFGFVGMAQLITATDPEGSSYWIGNLINSAGYGSILDTEDEIMVNTVLAINNLCFQLESKGLNTIYSNKFNSGLFKVPWEKTEAIIKVFVNRYNLTWIVCDPNLEE